MSCGLLGGWNITVYTGGGLSLTLGSVGNTLIRPLQTLLNLSCWLAVIAWHSRAKENCIVQTKNSTGNSLWRRYCQDKKKEGFFNKGKQKKGPSEPL